MRELLYTKYRLDYAYFEIIDHECHQVDAFAFSMLENKLLQPENLKLPGDSKINQTEAFYFDTASGLLKIVRWNYSVENDTRGYVESRFQEVQIENSRNFALNPDLLAILKELLAFTYHACSEKSSVFLKIDSNQLFEDLPDQSVFYLFLRLYYLFLPSEFAERVIFINRYADTVRNFGKFPAIQRNSIPPMRPDQEKSCLMQILHQTENLLEYRTMLRFVSEEFFHYSLQLEEISDSNPDYMQEFEKTVRLWQKVQQAFQKKNLPQWELLSRKKLHDWLIRLLFWLIQQLCDPKSCKTFDVLFVHYKKILAVLQKEKNAGIYQDLYQELYFHNFHHSDPAGEKSYLRNSFRILSDTEINFLPEDIQYYTEICFSSVKSLSTVSEIYSLINLMTNGNISDFFDALDFSILDSHEVENFYLWMEQSVIQALQEYSGYCQDAAFEELRKELNLVILFSDSVGFDFRRSVFENYAKKSQNHIQVQCFADYFLYRTITLTELLKFFSGWKPEEFYTKIPLGVFHALASALQYSRLSQNEKKAFSSFLAQYQEFRKELDHLLTQENSDFQNFCSQHLELIQAHITVYNTCNSQDAKQLLLFLNQTILGSPAILVCMMELYAEKFLPKPDQKKYHYYYQFYELLFLPLFEADQLSLQDLHYFIWMFQKNEFLTSQTKSVKLFQDLEKKFAKTFSEILVSGKQKNFKNFPELLLHRLSTRYSLSDSEQQSLRNQLESCHMQYRNMIHQDAFQNYSSDYVQWLKKYITAMIKNF